MWAVYAWFRQKDELIDGAETAAAKRAWLEIWQKQTECLFTDGLPAELTDVALIAAIAQYHLSIEPFTAMLAGQRMSLEVSRYQTWIDLELYCYRVAGTVGLVSASVLGATHSKQATEALVKFGIAMQLTNILQDVGADAHRGKIYLPLEDLKRFGYTEKDLFESVVDSRWIALMRYEIQRARSLYAQAKDGLGVLPSDVRWPMWTAWLLYRQDLIAIERSGYQVFGDRPLTPLWWKVKAFLIAWRLSHQHNFIKA